MTPSRGRPGALPSDGETLARDQGECQACGQDRLLAPGSLLCRPCEDLARAIRPARGRANAVIVQPTPEQLEAVATYQAPRSGSRRLRSPPTRRVSLLRAPATPIRGDTP